VMRHDNGQRPKQGPRFTAQLGMPGRWSMTLEQTSWPFGGRGTSRGSPFWAFKDSFRL